MSVSGCPWGWVGVSVAGVVIYNTLDFVRIVIFPHEIVERLDVGLVPLP